MDLGDYIRTIPKNESLLLGAALSRHVGKIHEDAGDCQGNHAYGIYKEEEERILEFSETQGPVMGNTYFNNRGVHLTTFASRNTRSKVDFWVMHPSDLE